MFATAMDRSISRVNQPMVSRVSHSTVMPARCTCPKVGLKPTTPLNAAGRMMDPPVCVPIARGTIPAATAAADPLDDPPGECARFHGFRVGPGAVKAYSAVTVLPIGIAPAARSCATQDASKILGGVCANDAPQAVGMPFTSMTSLTPNSRPLNGPDCSAGCSTSLASARYVHAFIPVSPSLMVRNTDCNSTMRRLLNGDVLLLDQLGPPLGFATDEGLEILRAATGDLGPLRLHNGTIAFRFERLIHGLVQLGDDIARHAGGSNHAEPVGGHQIDALLFECGYVRQCLQALIRCHGQGPDARLVGRRVRDEQTGQFEVEIHVAGDQVVRCRRAAAVGDVNRVESHTVFEQLADQMGSPTGTCRCIVQLIGVRLSILDQFRGIGVG